MNLSLLRIKLLFAIIFKNCHGYFSEYEENNQCSYIIEQRIVNLEEPGMYLPINLKRATGNILRV